MLMIYYVVMMKMIYSAKMIAVVAVSHLVYSTIIPPSTQLLSHHQSSYHPTINPAITSPTAHLLMIVCPISVCVSISKVSCSRAWLREEVLLKSVDRVMRLFVPTASILSMSSLVCTRNSLSPMVVWWKCNSINIMMMMMMMMMMIMTMMVGW